MAASLSVKFLNPSKIWASFTILSLMLLVGFSFGIWEISQQESQRIADAQMDTLLRTGMDKLTKGDFRSFLENSGKSFPEIYYKIEAGDRLYFCSMDCLLISSFACRIFLHVIPFLRWSEAIDWEPIPKKARQGVTQQILWPRNGFEDSEIQNSDLFN